MTTPLEPNWNLEWDGHPSGNMRYIHVFFKNNSTPGNGNDAARELAQLAAGATNEGLFNNAVLTFAERHKLRVVQVVTGPDHRYPGGDVITVTFEALPPLASDFFH